MQEQLHPTTPIPLLHLTDRVIALLDSSLDALSPTELLCDRAALKNLTGALDDLCALRERLLSPPEAPTPDATPSLPTPPAVTVAFLGETEDMCQ